MRRTDLYYTTHTDMHSGNILVLSFLIFADICLQDCYLQDFSDFKYNGMKVESALHILCS